MTNKNYFDTPILLISWCRPEKTLKIIERMKVIKPNKLYLASDGPISNDKKNKKKVRLNRELLNDKINWLCEKRILYSDINQGCKYGVSNAINWFFENETEGIILEDDCLPHLDFFYFCRDLLKIYRDDKRIWSITGQNMQNNKTYGDGSYYFSKYSHCWGWASWRRCWEKYDRDIKSWPANKEINNLKNIFENKKEIKFWSRILDNLYYESRPDTWDYQWSYTCFINSGLTIVPNKNLIENIGFDQEATHTKENFIDLSIEDFSVFSSGLIPIKHPENIIQNKKADKYTKLICYSGINLTSIEGIKIFLKKLKYKIKGFIFI